MAGSQRYQNGQNPIAAGESSHRANPMKRTGKETMRGRAVPRARMTMMREFIGRAGETLATRCGALHQQVLRKHVMMYSGAVCTEPPADQLLCATREAESTYVSKMKRASALFPQHGSLQRDFAGSLSRPGRLSIIWQFVTRKCLTNLDIFFFAIRTRQGRLRCVSHLCGASNFCKRRRLQSNSPAGGIPR